MDIFSGFFASILIFFSGPIVKTESPTPTPSPSLSPTIIKKTPTPTKSEEKKALTALLIKPLNSQTFHTNETVDVEVAVSGYIQKVEFYIASGILIETKYTPPYKTTIQLSKYTQGISSNYRLPLGIKVYPPSGDPMYLSQDINVVPETVSKPNEAASPQTNLSYKDITFTKDDKSQLPNPHAEGYFTVEQYDAFNNSTSIKTKGNASNLKPNTEYDVFVITKKDVMSIGSLNTNGEGFGEFFTGLGTDQHYCDIYSLGIRQKGVPSEDADLWSGPLTDICPRG